MAGSFESGTLGQIQFLLDEGTLAGVSDSRLLERFVARRDEAAFAALVTRHGSMVRSTCRAVLKDPGAADDAFQATFLLLFRKAGSIRGGGSLGGWLHRVSYRVAIQAGTAAARRRDVEAAAGASRGSDSSEVDDRGPIVHDEIERLPERFRLPVVLCDLEGLTREQAAVRLGWTEGTLRGRLGKGRELLRRRLTRRGVAPAAAPPVAAAIPESLVATTVKAVGGGVSTPAAAALAAAVARAWLLARLRAAAFLTLGLGAAAILAFAGVQAVRSARATVAKPTMTVSGRILDLEGRPVGGATVSVKYLQAPPDGKIQTWIDEVKRLGKRPIGLPVVFLANPNRRASATTGPDGRFRLDDLPQGSIATASISGPEIETTEVYILVDDVPTIRVKDKERVGDESIVYYGARFEHAAAPARVVVGTVRDKDSGAPVPGVHLSGMPYIPHNLVPTPGVEATTDAQGRYELRGLSLSRGFRVLTEAPPGAPYVNGGFVAPASPSKSGPFPFDITLKRGVLVRGRLIDKATRQPVRGSIQYFAFQDNPHLEEYPNFRRDSLPTRFVMPGNDGVFTIAALPGRGLITARAQDERYLHGLGADGIKGFDRAMGAFTTAPFYCMTSDQHVLAEINPAPDSREVALELQVDPGRSVTGTVLGPDGRPIVGGYTVHTLDVFQSPYQHVEGAPTFTVTGLPTGRYRLDVVHKERKLAGALRLQGGETGTLVVKLQPWGTVTGRVVDEDGKPRTDVMIFSTTRDRPDPDRGDLLDKPTVDSQGRFRIEGLVPGVAYDALGHQPRQATAPILKGVKAGAGEVKDLGDITLPSPKDEGD